MTAYEKYNKMGISNLALIFGPNLLQAPAGFSPSHPPFSTPVHTDSFFFSFSREGSDGSELLKDMPLINQIASNLITNCEALFKVPSPIHKI